MKTLGTVAMMLIGLTGLLMAAPPPFEVPEIDPTAGANAVALLFGAGLMIRSRRKR